jgi:hypothetical protein
MVLAGWLAGWLAGRQASRSVREMRWDEMDGTGRDGRVVVNGLLLMEDWAELID